MKYLIFICILTCSAGAAFAQVTNPPIIFQDTDIALHFTDVYYAPYKPPSLTDTREQLCNIAAELRDPNGVRRNTYDPITHGYHFIDSVPNAVWMRLFTANDKAGGAHSDIIAGGNVGDSVIISKNEDVDFRASGTIKLKNGFHAKPGSFFHAYIAPTFDTAVFSDEFDSASLSKWFIPDGWGPSGGVGKANGAIPSNLTSDFTDTEAYDHHALRIDLIEDTTLSQVLSFQDIPSNNIDCSGDSVQKFGCAATNQPCPPTIDTFMFSTGVLLACPWPFKHSDTPQVVAYQNAPYGKYEIREKIPHVRHHTNNWGGGEVRDEWNLNETYGGVMDQFQPGLTHRFIYGPAHGRFYHDTLRSFDSVFCWTNVPYGIIINGFPYEVALTLKDSVHSGDVRDTFVSAIGTSAHEGGFPSSLTSSTDTFTFYYSRQVWHVTDSLPWSLSTDGKSFSGAYAVDRHGDSLYFSKSYQPTNITTDLFFPKSHTYSCHWDHDSGKVLFDPPMPISDPHSGHKFSYLCEEGPAYPVPPFTMDTSGYKYHKYTMEFLPHEAEFLVDGHVMRRFPDRLIPQGDIRYDYVTTYPRSPLGMLVGELEIDDDAGSFGPEKAYFEAHSADCEGCWDVSGHHSAHHLLDYAKIWDLPSSIVVPNFPH